MADCCSTLLIDPRGVFNVSGLENFVKTVKFAQCGLNYALVSIMGPQSSGKSTLLNHLFYTNFREMDAYKGRTQTTKGIWIAKCIGIEPFTIVMDLEGTDGRDRGENDTAFEKQSALFALAISDIVLINIWCHDIGREHAANKPLLKTIFQVMLRLFTPRKTTLMFVIRDKTKTPFSKLESLLREDVRKIWHTMSKPRIYKDTPLIEFFRVEVTALSSYEEKEEQFKEQVQQLRLRFFHSTAPGGLAADRQGVVPASGFSFSAQQIWKVIQENKDLDLPAHKVMVANVRCDEIANDKFSCLKTDKRWLELEADAQSGHISGFGKRLSSVIDSYLSEYDTETEHFDEDVRMRKRKQLLSKVLQLVQPTYQAVLGLLCCKTLRKFKDQLELSLRKGMPFADAVRDCISSCLSEFEERCIDVAIKQAEWDASEAHKNLHRNIMAHVSSVRSIKLSEMMDDFKEQIADAINKPMESLLDTAGRDTWVCIRKLFVHEVEEIKLKFSTAVSGFELEQETFDKMIMKLAEFARSVVEKKAREEAGKVLIRMKDRFTTVLSHDCESLPRVWTGKEDIRKIIKDAQAAALMLMSVLAVIRLDEVYDNVEDVLFHSLLDGTSIVSGSRKRSTSSASIDPLSANTWANVPLKDTLISPVQCKSLWRQFNSETDYLIAQAISSQEAIRHRNSWMPPPWAILALFVLGFNEFMFLLKNPSYLLILFIIYLLLKALWIQLDIPGELQYGTLSGTISLSSRILPAGLKLLKRLVDSGQALQEPEAPRRVISNDFQSNRSQTQKPMPLIGSTPDPLSSLKSKSSSSVK